MKNRLSLSLILALLNILLPSVCLSQRTIKVGNCNDCVSGNIQAAIDIYTNDIYTSKANCISSLDKSAIEYSSQVSTCLSQNNYQGLILEIEAGTYAGDINFNWSDLFTKIKILAPTEQHSDLIFHIVSIIYRNIFLIGNLDSGNKPLVNINGKIDFEDYNNSTALKDLISEMRSNGYFISYVLHLANLDITSDKSLNPYAIKTETVFLSNVNVKNSKVGVLISNSENNYKYEGNVYDYTPLRPLCAWSGVTGNKPNEEICLKYNLNNSKALFENNNDGIAFNPDSYINSAEFEGLTFTKNKVGLNFNAGNYEKSAKLKITSSEFSGNSIGVLKSNAKNADSGPTPRINFNNSKFLKNKIGFRITSTIMIDSTTRKNQFRDNNVVCNVKAGNGKYSTNINKFPKYGKYVNNKKLLKEGF